MSERPTNLLVTLKIGKSLYIFIMREMAKKDERKKEIFNNYAPTT